MATVFRAAVVLGLVLSVPLGAYAVDDELQREGLVALFDSTHGPDWFESRNWSTDAYYCGWYGVRCCGQWCWPGFTIRSLRLAENNLRGVIPPEIEYLPNLSTLELQGNHLSGGIPPEIGRVFYLQELWLNENDLSGPIPVEIGDLSGLNWLRLGNNRLSGSIPDEMLGLEHLEYLDLESNELTGSLPPGLFGMSWLWILDLSSNRFEGPLPRNLTDVQIVDLRSNRFTGVIPTAVVDSSGMEWIDLRWNALYSDEPEVVAFIDARQEGGDWQSTQTIAPEGLRGRLTADGSAQLNWQPVTYQENLGGYEVYYAHSGDPWQLVGTIDSKTDTAFTVNDLEDDVSHHFTVRTFTEPHENNKNRVVSDPGPTLTLSSAGQLAIPAVARVRGVGVFFSSSLTAYNSGDGDLEIALTYTPRADIGGPSRNATWQLAAGAAETIDDALAHLFGFTDEQRSVGSLVLSVGDADPEALMLQSVVTAHHNGGDEYGQLFPAFTFGDAIQAGQVAHLHTTVDVSRSRVNAGFMALEEATSARVRLVDPVGNHIGVTVFEFAGSVGDNHQLNDVFAVFGVEPVADSLVEITVDSGSLLAYGSVLDGTAGSPGTSDPTTILPFIGGSDEVVLLEMGSIQGHDEFDGSASITNVTTEEVVIAASFYQRATPGVAATAELTLPPGDTWGSERFIGELFDIEGAVGTTVLSTIDGSIAATGREYSIRRNAGGEVVGTAGQLIDGLTAADRLDSTTAWHFIGLRQDLETGRERTNFAAFNPDSEGVTLTMDLFDAATGQLQGSTEFTAGGQELIHVNDLIGTIDPEHDDTEKRIRVEVTGRVFMQVFRVNPSGDPVTLSGFPGS